MGVDVFFVISGYLITTIIIEDIENKRFSIIKFYERRARRILPALFFVMLVCIPFAWIWMYSSQMKDFSQSLVAVSLFTSNILFLRESGYFDEAAEIKPLLHTWSLSVEEQYYVIFPVFLVLAWHFGKKRVFWMIVVLAALSLLLSEWNWRNKTSANFYLATTRAWELLAGSITAFFMQNREVRKNNLLALVGFAAVTFAVFSYDEKTPFPGVYALVPVVGAVLIILYAEKTTLVAKLLSTRAFVGIGLISYSAYLWHQPIFAFARIAADGHPRFFLTTVLAFSSVALAYFSWRFIERPFRNTEKVSSTRMFLVSFFGIFFFMSLGLFGHYKDGFSWQEYVQPRVDTTNMTNVNLPVYVIGDSHAWHLIDGMMQLNRNSVILMAGAGCIPFRNVDRSDSRFEVGGCVKTINKYLDTLKSVKTPSVIIL